MELLIGMYLMVVTIENAVYVVMKLLHRSQCFIDVSEKLSVGGVGNVIGSV